MAHTRSVTSFSQARNSSNVTEPKLMHVMHEDIEASVPTKANMALANSRFALGDIGNIGAKVSSLTLDPGKKTGAGKKEILGQQPTVTRQKVLTRRAAAATTMVSSTLAQSAATNLSTISTSIKTSTIKSEIAIYQEPAPAVIVEPVVCVMPTTAMDISADRVDAFVHGLRGVEDIDANDHDNPQLVSEYINDIYEYMRLLERQFPVRPHYLEGAVISGKMRAILVDWLCQVHDKFHLLQETLYLTVAIIDRYLQEKPVTRNKLQLVGVTAMLLASKYEEAFAAAVVDFVYITDNAYTKLDIREMERDILRTLNFSFGRPSCLHFLRRYSKAGQVDSTKHTLAKYLMELTITEYDMVHLAPSLIAAAALYLSIKLLDNSLWTKTLAYYSTYLEEDLKPTVAKLASLVVKSESSQLTAIRAKYSTSKLMMISQNPALKSSLITELAAKAN